MEKTIYSQQYQLLLRELRKARKHSGLTQEQIAARLGETQSAISKYERGERRLDVFEFLALARAIGADPYELLKCVDRPDENKRRHNHPRRVQKHPSPRGTRP